MHMPASQQHNLTTMTPKVRQLGLSDHQQICNDMVEFTAARDNGTQDEIWFLQHHPVYTLGLNGKRHHLLHETSIPVVETDRGGQITYHGPGQLVAYLLVDGILSLGLEGKLELVDVAGARFDFVEKEILLGPSLQIRPLPGVHLDLVPMFGVEIGDETEPMYAVYLIVGKQFSLW